MVLNNGVDIVYISRIEKLMRDKKDRFYNRIFTPDEIKYIEEKNHSPQTVAGIFAAKEAISKL